jgi:hypothetical protein
LGGGRSGGFFYRGLFTGGFPPIGSRREIREIVVVRVGKGIVVHLSHKGVFPFFFFFFAFFAFPFFSSQQQCNV